MKQTASKQKPSNKGKKVNVFQELAFDGTNPLNSRVCIARQRGIEIECEIVICDDSQVYNLYHVKQKDVETISTKSLREACYIAHKRFQKL